MPKTNGVRGAQFRALSGLAITLMPPPDRPSQCVKTTGTSQSTDPGPHARSSRSGSAPSEVVFLCAVITKIDPRVEGALPRWQLSFLKASGITLHPRALETGRRQSTPKQGNDSSSG